MTEWARLYLSPNLEQHILNPKKALKQLNELEKIILNELGLKNDSNLEDGFINWFISIENTVHINDEFIIKLQNELSSIFVKYFGLDNKVNFHTARLYVKEQIPDNSKIEGNLIDWISLNFNNKVSLHNIHKQINCPNASLFVVSFSMIISHVLGLVIMKVKRLTGPTTRVESQQWVNIVLKHFNSGKDVLECQEELIENGFKEYAKL